MHSPAFLASATEDALVDHARGGDARAFAELVRRYRPRILALALHLTASPPDADDIAQEVFFKAFQHMAGFQGRSAFHTWIYRIALNEVVTVKHRRRRTTVDMNDPRVALAVAVDTLGQPGRAGELRETYAVLVLAFDQLSPLLRSTVALVTLQGLSVAETAAVMSTTEGTIHWRMNQAREQLHRTVRPEEARTARPVPRPERQRTVERDTPSECLAMALTLSCL